MIQIIGVLIAFYIAFRGLDGLTDKSKPRVVKVAGLIVIVIAVLSVWALLVTGSNMPSLPR